MWLLRTLYYLSLGLGEHRRKPGKSMLVTVDDGFHGFILTVASVSVINMSKSSKP
jgi:hypothetical protein